MSKSEREKSFIRSPIYYMGNKTKLLKDIIPLFPDASKVDHFLDVFGGSGVVSLNYKGRTSTTYNEFNPNISGLFKMFKDNSFEELDEFFNEVITAFDLKLLPKGEKDKEKIKEIQKGYYMLRQAYNSYEDKYPQILYILISYSVNNLIRFNKDNEFNASAGSGQRYRPELVRDSIDLFKDITVLEKDFRDIDYSYLTKDSFVYFDPPYSNTESNYNEKRAYGGWSLQDDYDLFKILKDLDSRSIKWALSNVYENRGKTNQHLIDWVKENGYIVNYLDREYHPFFTTKESAKTVEVLITNYKKENE